MLLLCAVLLAVPAKHHHHTVPHYEWWNPRYNLDAEAAQPRVRVGNHYWRMRDLMGQKI